jgi:hypothetical protein
MHNQRRCLLLKSINFNYCLLIEIGLHAIFFENEQSKKIKFQFTELRDRKLIEEKLVDNRHQRIELIILLPLVLHLQLFRPQRALVQILDLLLAFICLWVLVFLLFFVFVHQGLPIHCFLDHSRQSLIIRQFLYHHEKGCFYTQIKFRDEDVRSGLVLYLVQISKFLNDSQEDDQDLEGVQYVLDLFQPQFRHVLLYFDHLLLGLLESSEELLISFIAVGSWPVPCHEVVKLAGSVLLFPLF